MCNSSVTIKKYNIERHFQSNHTASFNQNYTRGSEFRKNEIRDVKGQLCSQQSLFKKLQEKAENEPLRVLKIANDLAEKKKTFTDDELLKEAFVAALLILSFVFLFNKKGIMSASADLQLFAQTAKRRI